MNETAENFQSATGAAPVLVHLLKGVLYRDQHGKLWHALERYPAAVRDYFSVIGLELVVDDAEGYAFLRQRKPEDDEKNPLPRLVQRRQLSYPVSLLCVLLRKRLVEQDAGGGDMRVVLSREQIVEMVRVFLPSRGNDAKTIDQINRHINKVIEFGFLRPLQGQDNQFEIRRIIKALFNADWLAEFAAKLEAYRAFAESEGDD